MIKSKKIINSHKYIAVVIAFFSFSVITVVAANRSTIKLSLSGENVALSPGATKSGAAIKFNNVLVPDLNTPKYAKRFFSDDASWNKPVSAFGESASLNQYAKRLWDFGGGTKTDAPPGTFFPNFKDDSVPVYDIKTATTTVRVFQTVWAQNQQAFSPSYSIGATIPWNPAWRPGGYQNTITQNDKIMAVANFDTGETIEMWRVEESKMGCFDLFGPNAQAGYDVNNAGHLCIAGINKYDNLFTAKEGSTVEGRGMGINKLALLTRADEVASGKIEHALELTISNPMFGPELVDWNHPEAGTSKGFFVKPATRLEHKYPSTLSLGGTTVVTADAAERSKTVPSGMRFAIKISDAEIETWLKSKASQAQAKGDQSWAYNGPKSNTARIFAVAWRDYGAIVGETGGWGIGIETDGVDGPAKDTWAKLGIVSPSTEEKHPVSDLFTGLLTRDRLYVVNPPQ